MKVIFYTICDTTLQQGLPNSHSLDFIGFMNSFKRFHPDIEMKVFNEHDLADRGLNYYNAKATLGRELSEQYDLVVNIDADHYIFARLDEILAADYDVACPANFNQTDNLVGIKVTSGINGVSNQADLVSIKDFLQGGLIASTNKQFWRHYEYATQKYYDRFVCKENDVLNIVAYTYPYKVKVLDGNVDFNHPEHNCFYGCGIYPFEKYCCFIGDKLTCNGKPVKAYHFAHGGGKRSYKEVFPESTHAYIKSIIE